MDRRTERDRKLKMEQLANDISQVRMEMKIRRDPETEEVYSYVTKQRICRKLLLLKRITVSPEQININRLAASVLTRGGDDDDDDMNMRSLEMIRDAGSYVVSLDLDDDYDYKFEFRLNVRYNDIERSNKTPFVFDEEDADVSDDEDDKRKGKRALSNEMRTKLKKWNRGKRANIMLDHLLGTKSRYSDLYNVSKLDLTPQAKTKVSETEQSQQLNT